MKENLVQVHRNMLPRDDWNEVTCSSGAADHKQIVTVKQERQESGKPIAVGRVLNPSGDGKKVLQEQPRDLAHDAQSKHLRFLQTSSSRHGFDPSICVKYRTNMGASGYVIR